MPPAARAAGAALAAVLALGACGSSPTDPPAAPAGATTTSEPAVTESIGEGPFAVGRRTVDLTDPDRPGRELTTDVWYPVEPETALEAPLSDYVFIPGVQFTTDAVADEAIAGDGPYPLVVFSHGSPGLRFQNSYLTEQLASHGFVVISTDHPGDTLLDVFAGTGAELGAIAVDRPLDVSFLIDAVEAGAGPLADLAGVVDTANVSVVGHSLGGYTALAAAGGVSGAPADPRIGAVVGMAAATEGMDQATLDAVQVPTLLVSGTADVVVPIDPNTERPWESVPGRPLYRVDIDRGGHQSFSDVCFYQEEAARQPEIPPGIVDLIDAFARSGCLPRLIDADRAHEIVIHYVTAFLLHHVTGDDHAAALDPAAAEQFPEIDYRIQTTTDP